MTERFSDARLDAVLASVGTHLVVPDLPVRVTALAGRRHQSSARVLALVAAALIVVVLLAGTLITPVRDAVADWLGIGSTRIVQVSEREGDPSGLPEFSAGAVPVTAVEARARFGRSLPVVADQALGRPALLATPPEGGVLMAWPQGKTSLWAVRDDGDAPAIVKKLLTFEDGAEPVPNLGESAVLIEGRHVVETPERRVAAGRVLLWVDDGVQYRLESDLSAARMEAIARSIRLPG